MPHPTLGDDVDCVREVKMEEKHFENAFSGESPLQAEGDSSLLSECFFCAGPSSARCMCVVRVVRVFKEHFMTQSAAAGHVA